MYLSNKEKKIYALSESFSVSIFRWYKHYNIHRLEGNLHNKMYNIIYKALGNFEAENSEEREA